MSYCINPRCAQRHNPDREAICLSCGTPLVLQDRYRLLRPLRELDEWEPTEVFEIVDLKPLKNLVDDTTSVSDAAAQSEHKVLKILKKPVLLPLFEREAMTLQQLSHPGIPRVEPDAYFSVIVPGQLGQTGQAGDRELHCLVMENIQGSDLDQWLKQHGPIDEATALKWLSQLVELLELLHETELFHRDIKLSNIMLRPTGQLALIDFGTVRPLSNTYFAKIASQRDITSVMSPGYTPLEQVNGRAVPQSDFYALGRSLVYLLTGQHPLDLDEDSTSGRLAWQAKLPQPLSPWFTQLLDEMMAPFPGQRPLNARSLRARLEGGGAAALTEVSSSSQAKSLNRDRPLQQRLLILANCALLLIQLFVFAQWLNIRRQIDQPVGLRGRFIQTLANAPFLAEP